MCRITSVGKVRGIRGQGWVHAAIDASDCTHIQVVPESFLPAISNTASGLGVACGSEWRSACSTGRAVLWPDRATTPGWQWPGYRCMRGQRETGAERATGHAGRLLPQDGTH